MISTGLCRTSTPRNCKQDYESPLHLNFSKIPAPLDWREAPTRRCVVGFLATKPGTLGIFVGGDPIFLPSDFSPLSSAPSLSITGRDHCVVAKIYLPGPVVGDLIRANCQLPRDRSLHVEFLQSEGFSFWTVSGRQDLPECDPP